MKMTIDLNNPLLIKAKKLSGIKDNSIIVEKALQLLITIESQKKLKNLWGNIELDDKAFE